MASLWSLNPMYQQKTVVVVKKCERVNFLTDICFESYKCQESRVDLAILFKLNLRSSA